MLKSTQATVDELLATKLYQLQELNIHEIRSAMSVQV